MDKKKRAQLIALAALLAVVIAGGFRLFTHGAPQESESGSALPADVSAAQAAGAPDPASVRYQFELADYTAEQIPESHGWWNELYADGGRLVCMQLEISEEYWMTVRDAATGEIVRGYTYDDMGSFSSGFAYAPDGDAVWLIYSEGADEYRIRRILPGKEPEEYGQLEDYPFRYAPRRFAVRDNTLVMQGNTPDGANAVLLFDLQTGRRKLINDAFDFCLDGEGGLYYLMNPGEGGAHLVKYALAEGKILWEKETRQSENVILQQLFFHPQMGLFTIARDTGRIDCRDTETGAVRYTLFSVAEDTGLQYADEAFFHSFFAVDGDCHVWLRYTDTDFDASPMTHTRYTWEYAPCQPQTDRETVTLTITAPYAPDAMVSSMHMYQGKHPEVQAEWDIRYLSRADFTAHASQYAEQLTLRLMAGDVGDIMMLHGSALDIGAVLETDVMADLSGYLAGCPFRDELEESYLRALTREDGSVPALPVAIQPSYWIYNETLAEETGVNWDTAGITWPQVLDLAGQWQAEGRTQSVFWTSAGNASGADYVLYALLLEDLDAFVMEDGSVDLHQDWLMKGLEQLAELQDSPQLYGVYDNYWWYSLENCLIFPASGADYGNLFGWLYLCKENCGVELRILPVPKGEKTGTRQGYAFAWGIPEVSRKKDAAWDFLAFMVSSDGLVADTYFADTCLLNKAADRERAENAIRSKALDFQTSAADYEQYYDQLRASLDHPISRLVEPKGWYTAIGRPVEQYLAGDLSLDEALTAAEENWERALAE